MRKKTLELFEANSDIVSLMTVLTEIGWKEVREQSIHRIVYLSSVLHAFLYPEENNSYNSFHFSITQSGPFSTTISRSIIDLKVREILMDDENGNLLLDIEKVIQSNLPISPKTTWFKIVTYILGKYGESKIFGFVIQDPQYKEYFQRNSHLEIDLSNQNKTVEFLNEFKKTFENSITNASQIDKQEYLELYFEYIFSKIIRREK